MNIENYNLICPLLRGKEQVKLWLKQMARFAKVIEEINMSDLREAEAEEKQQYNLKEWQKNTAKKR